MPQPGSWRLLALAPLLLHFAIPQQSPSTASHRVQRDPQAIAILDQVVAASGGLTLLGAVQDITASGDIMFNWGDDGVSGQATFKGRGTGQLRIETNLPDGARVWIASRGRRFRKDVDGSVTTIPYRDPSSFENVPFPVAHLIAALEDPSANLAFVALENRNGIEVNHISISNASTSDAAGVGTKPQVFDVFVDAKTNQIESVLTVASANDSSDYVRPREIRYSDYRPVNGISMPFSIAELIDGQQTFSLQISQISFNTGLTDGDFTP